MARASTMGPDAPERLHEPRRMRVVDVGRQRAGEARQGVEAEADQQHGLAPDPVGDRPVEELAHREAEQEDRQGELRLSRPRRESPGDVRQRRQIHVGRERTERGQKREDDREAKGIALEHGTVQQERERMKRNRTRGRHARWPRRCSPEPVQGAAIGLEPLFRLFGAGAQLVGDASRNDGEWFSSRRCATSCAAR